MWAWWYFRHLGAVIPKNASTEECAFCLRRGSGILPLSAVASQCLANLRSDVSRSRKGTADSCFWASVGWLCLEAGNTCLLLQNARGISVPWIALFADGVEGLF